MSKIDRKYDFLNLIDVSNYDYTDKQTNNNNSIAYMLNRSAIMFKYHDLPETIPQTDLENLLQCNGFCVIGKINDNLYALNAGLGGETDVYNHPTKAIVSVPYLNYNSTWDIDKNCIVVKSDSNAIGLIPMYAKYCSIMNECDISLILALVNKRIQSVFSANDDNTYNSAKEYLKQVFDGKQGIISESKLLDSLKVLPATTNSNDVLSEIYNVHISLKKELFNEIGLATYNQDKKERVTNAEIELNSENLYPLVDDMLNNRRIALDKVNKMFGTNITVELNSSWDYRVFNGKSIHDKDIPTEKDDSEVTEEETENNDTVDNETENHDTDTEHDNSDTNNDTDTDSDTEDKEDKTE